ncbi:hypothetical protein BP5796_00370 [Coleophoma crateriformis]|uniref:Uncharacterized protein n=1 Tax=Coleophoma crateriformis TaxID=565419 RepID=A0A3D8T7R8_9HELO|nr:hypothetical protein BP5796_00370 [Coleophoma crateriformis]
MATIDELERDFDDHPSLDVSLQDFEHPGSHSDVLSPTFGYLPSQHSGFRSDSDSEMADSISGGRFSPPAWRREGDGKRSSGFWNKTAAVARRRQYSRESSAEYESADDGDATLAAALRTRLPTGSLSPEKQRSPSPEPAQKTLAHGKMITADVKQEEPDNILAALPQHPNNYIRFAVRAEVNHRTEPIETAINFIRDKFNAATQSWTSLLTFVSVALFSILALQTLFLPGTPPPVPDLVKVAGLAKAFEPLIFYSENGIAQIADLQATGVAVWDLGESVRSTNMTSAPIIVKELDDLSDSLKTLAIELTRFFTNVDGDVDGILIVMDWAKRELSQLTLRGNPSLMTTLFSNIHVALSRVGVLESPTTGLPTKLGHITTSIFGQTLPQATRHTLQRTFNEFLTVLEEAINNELQHSLALFALFESIDRQFLNLARTVIRETTAQDNAQDDLLSSLWAKILGPNSATIAKFEKNKKLLSNIRAKTVQNKSILLEHNSKLLTLKSNLESLRRKLVSPLVRQNGSTIGIEEQIRGLEDVGVYLGGVRERQRGKLMEMLYGSGSNVRGRISRGEEYEREIEGRWDR